MGICVIGFSEKIKNCSRGHPVLTPSAFGPTRPHRNAGTFYALRRGIGRRRPSPASGSSRRRAPRLQAAAANRCGHVAPSGWISGHKTQRVHGIAGHGHVNPEGEGITQWIEGAREKGFTGTIVTSRGRGGGLDFFKKHLFFRIPESLTPL